MEEPSRPDMQQLVESRPWRAYAVYLYQRFVNIQHQLHSEMHEQRHLQGRIQELMGVLTEPYRIAGYRTPFEVVSEAEIRQWLGDLERFQPDLSTEERIADLEATIVRAQAELRQLVGSKSAESNPPWEGRRHSGPV